VSPATVLHCAFLKCLHSHRLSILDLSARQKHDKSRLVARILPPDRIPMLTCILLPSFLRDRAVANSTSRPVQLLLTLTPVVHSVNQTSQTPSIHRPHPLACYRIYCPDLIHVQEERNKHPGYAIHFLVIIQAREHIEKVTYTVVVHQEHEPGRAVECLER
jgi:hypothetical protein